jgi:hypothetical protein
MSAGIGSPCTPHLRRFLSFPFFIICWSRWFCNIPHPACSRFWRFGNEGTGLRVGKATGKKSSTSSYGVQRRLTGTVGKYEEGWELTRLRERPVSFWRPVSREPERIDFRPRLGAQALGKCVLAARISSPPTPQFSDLKSTPVTECWVAESTSTSHIGQSHRSLASARVVLPTGAVNPRRCSTSRLAFNTTRCRTGRHPDPLPTG